MNTFGYNGVIEIGGQVLEKVLGAQAYERNFVEIAGSTPTNEFLQIDLQDDAGGRARVFLRLGPVGLELEPAAQDDRSAGVLASMRIAIFRRPLFGPWVRVPMNLPFLGEVRTVVIGVSPVTSEQNEAADEIRLSFESLTEQGLSFFLPDPGAGPVLPEDLPYPLTRSDLLAVPDQWLDDALAAAGVNVTAAEIKAEIVARLKAGAMPRTQLRVPAEVLPSRLIRRWEYRLLSADRPGLHSDGVDVLLYADTGDGRGLREQAGNTMPTDASPPYLFAVNLYRDVLLDLLGQALDENGYFRQEGITDGGVANAPDHPTGYMLVPTAGEVSYTIPAVPDGGNTTVTLSAPIGGIVHLTVPGHGFMPGSRGSLHNISTGATVDFAADDEGAAVIQIPAAADHRLALEVLAIAVPGVPGIGQLVVWRPTYELIEGALRLSLHFLAHDVEHLCDADVEGYAELEVALEPDLNTRLDLKPRVLSTSIDLPWWLDAANFLAFNLIKVVVATKIRRAIYDRFEAPTPSEPPPDDAPRVAVFLERVEMHPEGMALYGYADAGWIREKDRRQVGVFAGHPGSVVLGRVPNALQVTWGGPTDTLALEITYHDVAVVSDPDPASLYWRAPYQDAVDAEYAGRTVSIPAGGTVMFWVRLPGTFAKVLATWQGSFLTARYVMYEPRVLPRAAIAENLDAILTFHIGDSIIQQTCFRYQGTISLDVFKYYRSEVLRRGGLEHWYWDEVEVPLGGWVTQPGVAVEWNDVTNELIVTINQYESALTGATTAPGHMVRYEGEDVFGEPIEASLFVPTPACTTNRSDYPIIDFYPPDLPDPIPELPVSGVIDPIVIGLLTRTGASLVEAAPSFVRPSLAELRPRLGNHPLAYRALRTLSRAVEEGSAELDGQVAGLLVASMAGSMKFDDGAVAGRDTGRLGLT